MSGSCMVILWSVIRVLNVVWSKLTTRAHIIALDVVASWGLLVVEGDRRRCLSGRIGISAAVVLLCDGLGCGVAVDI